MAKSCLNNVIFIFILSTLLFLILLLPLLSIIFCFFVYRCTIYAILRIQLGPKFWGLLNGLDMLFSLEGPSKSVLCILATVETKDNFEDFLQKLKKQLQTKILENPQKFSKLLATRHYASGFYYLIKNQVKIDDCIRILKVETKNKEITKEELLTELDTCFSDLLPHNHTYLWEFLVCEKPLKSNKADKTEHSYAVLARIHHTVGDGISLLKCFFETLADSNQGENGQTIQEPSQNLLVRLLTLFQNISICIFYVLMAPITILKQRYTVKPENNSLHSSGLTNENILVAKVEETSECIKIIKNVKKRNGTTFNNVLLAAVSKSFSNYFQSKNKDPNLTSMVVSISGISKTSDLLLPKMKSTQLRNNFSFEKVKIPIIYRENSSSSSKSDTETLEAVKKEYDETINSYDSKISSYFIKLTCSLFPLWIIPRIMGPKEITMCFTNMPGPPLTTIWDGCLIEDVTVWLPVIGRFGVMLLIFSYDNRLQIALTVNKGMISQREDAQSLVDGIHHAIIQMDSNV